MTLEQSVFKETLLLNLCCAFLIFAYSAVITQMPVSVLFPAIGIVIVIVIVAQFTVSPVINHFFSHRLSVRVEAWKTGSFTQKERTDLLEQVVHFPMSMLQENILIFFTCSCVLFAGYDIFLKVPRYENMMSFAACVFGSFVSGFITQNFWRKRTSVLAWQIIEQGIDAEYVMRKKYFGLSLQRQLAGYILIPVFCTTGLSVLILIMSYIPLDDPLQWPAKHVQLLRMFFVLSINFGIECVLAVLFYIRVRETNQTMSKVLESMEKGNLVQNQLLNTDVSDEIAHNFFLTDQMLLLFRSILNQSAAVGQIIMNSSTNLMAASKQTSATALEQSAGAREIVVTMENLNQLSHDIENKVTAVAAAARKTADDVQAGSDTLADHLDKMSRIASANDATIREIKELNRKMSGIWEIVTIISSITDQTKIIAFNAELEAAGVHESEKDFRTVSIEIRRLADSTMDSTGEIRERINEIQQASDNLIKLSQHGSEQVSNVTVLAATLEERFSRISETSDLNAASADDIKQQVSQQTVAFEQIAVTLRQISAGVDSFSESAQRIIATAEKLRDRADDLGSVRMNRSTQKSEVTTEQKSE
jgi:methyl-accepting chemotaxis protein